MNDTTNIKTKIVLAFTSICIIWGSTFLAIRFALESFPPVLLGAIRFLTAGCALYLWGRLSGAPRPSLNEATSSGIAGVLMLAVGSTGVVMAEQSLPTGQVCLIMSTVPIFVTLLQLLRNGGSLPSRRVILGLTLGIAGLAILLGPAAVVTGHFDLIAIAWVLLAALGAAAGAIYARSAKLPKSPFTAAGLQMMLAGLSLFAVSVPLGELSFLMNSSLSTKSIVSLAYLIVCGSMLAYLAYTWLLKVVHPSIASTYTYVNPVVAILLGCLIAGEIVTVNTWIGAAIILSSLVLITQTQLPAFLTRQSERVVCDRTESV